MAEVKEESEIIVLSEVKPGLKREFQFALKSQNELAGLLSRHRVRKSPFTGLNEFEVVKQTKKMVKIKRPVGRPRKKQSIMSPVESEDEPKSDVLDVDVVSDDEESQRHFVESQRRENENDSVVDDDYDEGCLKKVPTKLKELLETGLLEGLYVRYIRGFKKEVSDKGIAGRIQGCGILCFCDDCRGGQVVTPNQFELHAGSANKRPADYIYLGNGKSLRDVINECKNANLNSLELLILNAIGASTEKKSTLCVECKELKIDAGVGRMVLCSSCAELEASHTTSMHGIVNYERTPFGLPV